MENSPTNQAKSQDARLCHLANLWWRQGKYEQDYQEMEELVSAGANVNFKDDEDNSPLSYAAKYDRCDLIELLLKCGADVDSKNRFQQTPLSVAAGHGSSKAMKLLIQAGANIDSQDWRGDTPLLWAVMIGQLEAVKILLAYGADTTIRNDDARSPYNYACMAAARDTTGYPESGAISNKIKELLDPSTRLQKDALKG
jgi:ankyrin repeat protein